MRTLDVVSYAGVPLALKDGRALGSLVGDLLAPDAFAERDLDTLAAMAGVIVHALRNELAEAPGRSPAQRLRDVACADELTGALNHPSFIQEVEEAGARAVTTATFVLDAQVKDVNALIARSAARSPTSSSRR